jgi:hypothetical protein
MHPQISKIDFHTKKIKQVEAFQKNPHSKSFRRTQKKKTS